MSARNLPVHRSSPGHLEVQRTTTLLVSVLVSLCSGTNYVYSAYGPQLGARLGLSHTQQNIVGLSGSIGVYGIGPFFGRLVDAKGPRIPLAMALVLLFTGYFGIKAIFDSGWGTLAPTVPLVGLVFCSFMTGAGGNGGYSSAINAVARSYPDKLASSLRASGFQPFFFPL
jgi:MFS family permease